ncbi:hypothetical protein C2G38_2220859 [Gigaspora rosea]|uniref:Uncharacterized protein n=1 Tax=Gigaspora rosea TaxID=44941 RepID=A0A397U493_9GLOM|nr:hypothetical protein C2G38_2220859 [Gigaspora rosea]
MANVIDLKKELYNALQDSSEIVSYNAKLRDKYEKQEKDFNQERNNKAISLANSKSENITKSKRIRSLESMIKILEKSEVLSLKSKITELERELALNISELEHLKSKNMSVSIVGGNNKKNITKSRPEGMDQVGKINGNILTYTNNEITELPKNDTEINPKVSDEIDISKTNKDNMLDTLIKPNIVEAMSQNITPYLAQRENISSLIELNSQMRHSLEASPFPIEAIPIVSSTLISPLSAYIFLTLLIIAVIWFIIL